MRDGQCGCAEEEKKGESILKKTWLSELSLSLGTTGPGRATLQPPPFHVSTDPTRRLHTFAVLSLGITYV